MAKTFFSNFLLGSKAAEEMFSSAAAEAVETVAAESANTENEAGDGDLESFFGEIAKEQAAADAEAEAAREAERTRLIRAYANSFRDRILKEITNKDWEILIRSYEKSASEEDDNLVRQVANFYNQKLAKNLPPSWWRKRAPELGDDLEVLEVIMGVVRPEVSCRLNVKKQAAASNLLKQVKSAAEELGLSEAEFPHKALSAADTEKAAIEIGHKVLILAVARAVRKSLLALRDCKVRISKPAEQAFYLITTSDQQKWGAIKMATQQLITTWQQLEQELCSRPGAPVEKLKKSFFTISLEERAIQVAGHCHLDLDHEVEVILASAGK